MSEASDHWFVRFPDGRVVRAANTTVVRQQVNSGKIPRNSSVRRSPDDEWTALEWMREFADLANHLPTPQAAKGAEAEDEGVDLGGEARPAPTEGGEAGGLSARLDRKRLPTVGVRLMAHELLAALDATLVRRKLAAAGLAGLCAGLVSAMAQLPPLPFEGLAPWVRGLVAGVLMLAIVTTAAAVLTRMTFLELSKMRPARWGEGFAGVTGTAFKIAVAQLLTVGGAGFVIAVLRMLPGWLMGVGVVGEALATAAAAVGLILEIVLWPICTFALLLPPILVVEDCSVGRALSHWLRLLRTDLGRVFLYEALALGLGLAATLLLALPWLALFTAGPDAQSGVLLTAMAFTRTVLAGIAAAPLLAYLMVANVFIYINLRYESAPGGRR